MEAAFLLAVLKSAANKLVLLINSEFASIIGVTKHLSELQGLFGDITSWLSAVGVRATEGGSLPNWLKQLKAVVNDFDDLLYRLEAEKHKADITGENHVMANWFYTKPKSLLFRTKMAQEVKEIKKRFAKIVKQRSDFNAIVTSSTLVTHHVQHELVLSFWKMDTKMEQQTHMEQAMSVVNVLEPPSRFPHMTAISLCYIHNVKHLTGLVELPSLKFLGLHNFGNLESINIGPFPSLIEFNIDSMPHSLELTTATRAVLADRDGSTICCNQKMQCSFPHLSDLDIRNCPKLNVNPCLPASMESLTLENSIVWPVHNPQGGKLELPTCSNRNEVSFCSTLVKRLEIRSMEGPSCNSDWEFLQHLGALKSLEIANCNEEVKQLPESMRSLTALQQLEISNCSGLGVLPEWLGELCSLKKLKISGCKNLRELSEGMQHLTSLQELIIQECDALYQLPEVGGLGGLLSVKLWMLPRLSCLPESIRSLTSLQKINITGCGAVHQLPEGLGELRYLRKIRIVELSILTSLPESFQGLVSLHKLNLTDCDALRLLPEKLGELRSLRTLIIWNLTALTCLPESIQDLTSLCELTIGGCDALTLLPESIGQLSALRSLNIRNCRGLKSLPRSIKRLAALQVLCMTGNPHLARRYKKGVGKDWHLISHIHHVSMDGMRN